MSADYEIHNVYFEPGSMVIGYIELPSDVRVDGHVVLQHQLRLSMGHPDYSEDALRIHDRIVKVLKNALDDFHGSEPFVPSTTAEGDDEETGMGE